MYLFYLVRKERVSKYIEMGKYFYNVFLDEVFDSELVYVMDFCNFVKVIKY